MAETGPKHFELGAAGVEEDRTSGSKSDQVIGEFLDGGKNPPKIDTFGHKAAKRTLITRGLIVNKFAKLPNSDTTRWVQKNKP